MSELPEAVEAVVRGFAPERVVRVEEPSVGLLAYVVLDSTALGPAAGGVRTARYRSEAEAVHDACRLARAMTYKCALGGLDAGGGKAVVMLDEALDRARAFELLGERVEALGGAFRTAGDLGTTAEDLAAMARRTGYVHTDTPRLAASVGRGVLRCVEACVELAERRVRGLRVAVQGCGDIGAAVAGALAAEGAELLVADLDPDRARAIAERTGATVVAPEEVLRAAVDVVSPCAVGGAIDEDAAGALRAWAVCGGANHVVASEAVDATLHRLGIAFVPDVLSSAGAVIDGVGLTVMGLADRTPLIDALGDTARAVLAASRRDGRPPAVHARERAEARIASGR
ncbi:MAG: Glu/Leu/Phe/Val dehydrogenase [Sandaracinaceae bacterium]|nr:Glu/Leu/Phe/Val dehydrogenase [Sandaracinaceae bacterium]